MLEAAHLAECVRYRTPKVVEANIEHGKVVELADLRRYAAGEVVVKEDDLVNGCGHATNAAGYAATEGVVGEDNDRGWRVAQVGGYAMA